MDFRSALNCFLLLSLYSMSPTWQWSAPSSPTYTSTTCTSYRSVLKPCMRLYLAASSPARKEMRTRPAAHGRAPKRASTAVQSSRLRLRSDVVSSDISTVSAYWRGSAASGLRRMDP